MAKRYKIGVIAIDSGLAEIWLAQRLVNAAKACDPGVLRTPKPPFIRGSSDCHLRAGSAFTIGTCEGAKRVMAKR